MRTKDPKTKSEFPHASTAPQGGVEADTDADADAKTQGDPVPQEEHTETVVGRNLAELIDEIHDEHRQFADSSSVSDTGDPGRAAHVPTDDAVDEVISAGEEALARALDSAVPRRSSPTDGNGTKPARSVDRAKKEVLEILHRELAPVLERIAENITAIQQRRMNHELSQRIHSVKRMAMQRLQENARKLRKVYASEYAVKDQELRERYERLMQLANKISQQKVEIQEARSRLQKKLQDANKLHRELNEIGETMSQQMGDLEGLVGDDTASSSKT